MVERFQIPTILLNCLPDYFYQELNVQLVPSHIAVKGWCKRDCQGLPSKRKIINCLGCAIYQTGRLKFINTCCKNGLPNCTSLEKKEIKNREQKPDVSQLVQAYTRREHLDVWLQYTSTTE